MTRTEAPSLSNKGSLTRRALSVAFALLVLALSLECAGVASAAANLEWIAVAKDGKGFVFAKSGRPFVPWGFNYDHDEPGRLIEDYWEREPTCVTNFASSHPVALSARMSRDSSNPPITGAGMLKRVRNPMRFTSHSPASSTGTARSRATQALRRMEVMGFGLWRLCPDSSATLNQWSPASVPSAAPAAGGVSRHRIECNPRRPVVILRSRCPVPR